MDVFIKDRNLQSWWDRGTETGEVRQDPPQLFLTEVRDYNVHWMVSETSIEDLKPYPVDIKGKWLHVKSTGKVSEEALGLRITLTGTGIYSGPMDIYIDNISLKIKSD